MCTNRSAITFQAYRLSRQSRFEDFYDVGDGDWGWITANIDEDGEQGRYSIHLTNIMKNIMKIIMNLLSKSCNKKNQEI